MPVSAIQIFTSWQETLKLNWREHCEARLLDDDEINQVLKGRGRSLPATIHIRHTFRML